MGKGRWSAASAVFAAMCSLAVPARADSVTIESVNVQIGASVYAPDGWTFPITVSGGQAAVLAQDKQGPPTGDTSFDFDSSDGDLSKIGRVSFRANGVDYSFDDTSQVLTTGGKDISYNEAQEWTLMFSKIFPTQRLDVYLGYADNVHTGGCGSWAFAQGLAGAVSCFPSPFTEADYFLGAPALFLVGVEGQGSIPCYYPQACAWDSGGLMFKVTDLQSPPSTVPEPASLSLLGVGLLVAVKMVRRRKAQGV